MKTPATRRNIYAFTLISCVLAIALVGLVNIWDLGMSGSLTFKVIGSLVVIASLSGFLFTLTYNHEKKLVKRLGTLTGVAAVALSAIILGQIWFDLFQEIIFGKLAATIVIIGLLAAFGIAMADDFFDSKKMKDENYLD